jgi:hypothetical protein
MARVAALPADGIPNGIALDQRHGVIYVADSLLSTIWRVSVATGAVTAWASGAQLAPDGGLGANGLKLHGARYGSATPSSARCCGSHALEVEQLIASDRPGRPVRPVLAAALVLAVAACGRSATYRVPVARPSAPGRVNLQLISGRFTLRFADSVSGTRCPRTAAADAQCFWLMASTGTRRFGRIMLGPTLDAEVPAGS